jgi:hypothetical protein
MNGKIVGLTKTQEGKLTKLDDIIGTNLELAKEINGNFSGEILVRPSQIDSADSAVYEICHHNAPDFPFNITSYILFTPKIGNGMKLGPEMRSICGMMVESTDVDEIQQVLHKKIPSFNVSSKDISYEEISLSNNDDDKSIKIEVPKELLPQGTDPIKLTQLMAFMYRCQKIYHINLTVTIIGDKNVLISLPVPVDELSEIERMVFQTLLDIFNIMKIGYHIGCERG